MLDRLSRSGLLGLAASIHPMLFAAVPVLFLFAQNAEQEVTLSPLWQPLAASVAGGLAMLLVFSAIFRDLRRGALLASALLILFFSYGHAWNLVGGILGQRWLLAAVWIALGFLAAGAIWFGTRWRQGKWMAPTGTFLTVVGALLIVFNVVRVVNYTSASASAAASVATEGRVALHAPATPPDVYYIILDRYAGAETLRDLYHFDNEPFLQELEKRGFVIARNSWANYFKTALSVYSSMSMAPISKEKLGETAPPYDFTRIFAAMQGHLAVPSSLKAIGYHYILLGNYWEPTAHNIDADVTLRYQESAEFSTALLATTFWSVFSPPVSDTGDDSGEATTSRDLARQTTLYTFDRLAETVDRPGPNFVFAHILLPHPPYVFGPHGEFLTEDQGMAETEKTKYVWQVEYANQKVLAAIDRLLSDPTDPVIVLQADEGAWPRAFTLDKTNFNWLTASDAQIAQKFRILNAIHLPNGIDPRSVGFNDRTSPVNEFRVVFDAVFGADLPMLPDMTYLSPDVPHMYDFVDYPPR
ncbi:MAG TPA: hypothetical protein VF153_08915 [Candidatus Limnocylindria bacterium]